MVKKFLLFLLICCSFAFSLSFLLSEPTLAKKSQTSYVNPDCNELLGFKSWNCNVSITNDQESLKGGIWMIAVNVLTDITVAAAYLVLGYVIYGGYLYIFSAGDPGKVATGKKTLSQAFIGLAIVMSANAIMSVIRFALLGTEGSFSCDPTIGNKECIDPAEAGAMVVRTIQWFIGMAGVVSAIFVVYGGIAYISSSGDPSKLQKAKSVILYALIGLAIVALAEFITAFVSEMIRNAQSASADSTIITKEVYENKQIS